MGNVKETIESGKAVLGIEFGSTRIKAVLIDEKHTPIAGEAMNGRTAMRMVCGHTALMIYGEVLQTVMHR